MIEDQVRLCIQHSDALLLSAEELLLQHEPLVDAITNRDAATAERLARSHNLEEWQRLSEQMALREGELENVL